MTARVAPRPAILPLALPLAGCTVGPDYHRPPPAFPPAPHKTIQMAGAHIRVTRDQKPSIRVRTAGGALNYSIRTNDERIKDHLEKIVCSILWERLTVLLAVEALRL
jgi:hypothetical protein